MSKDLYNQTIYPASEMGIASLIPATNGKEWLLYPNSQEPIQICIRPGQRVYIEVLVPNDGPAFIRYYRGE